MHAALYRMLALATALGMAAFGCASDDPLASAAAGDEQTEEDAPHEDDGNEATDATTAPPAIPEDAVDLTGESEVVVLTTDNRFTERIIVVTAGTEVTWVNAGLNRHNVLPSEDGAFLEIPTEALEPGMTASRVFDDVGDYPYYCSIHGTATRGQRGQIVVLPA